MNNTYILKPVVWGLASLLTLGACTKGFDDVNRNPLLPNDELLSRDGVLNGIYVPTLQFQPIPTGLGGTVFVNDYQIACNLTSDSYAGYLSPRDAKWAGRNLTQFYFDEGWTNGIFKSGVTNIFSPWIQLKKLNYDGEEKNLEIWSIAQISKIMGVHRTADKYGAIPYFKVGSGKFNVPYDSQEEVYKSFFKELEEAVDHLYSFSQLTSPIVPVASDVVYDGDAAKWAKLGNSLMLRLAMRVRFVDPELSKTWAEKAMNSPAGLIETLDEIAKLDEGAGFRTKNALYTIAGAYNDTRMGATIQVYLKGYRDPRINAYFEGDTNSGVPAGIGQTGNTYDKAAKPKVDEFSATYWFKSSETSFLKAEAAIAGYDTKGKTAQQLYEEGIRRSFAENNITSGVEAYIRSTAKPANFVDPKNSDNNAMAPSTATVAWRENDSNEQKLEKIIIQKYLAIYPDGTEAWTEWRRTGYPHMLIPKGNISNYGVVTSNGYDNGVRSIPYPNSEMHDNAENVKDAIAKYKGGNNSAATNVWWDKKEKK